MKKSGRCAAALAIAALIFPSLPDARQSAPEFIAFRVDKDHVIVTIKVVDDDATLRQVRDGLSPRPVAEYGYRSFEPSQALLKHLPPGITAGGRWIVHAAPGHSFEAVAERIVGGEAQCNQAIGLLLKIAPDRAAAFAASPAHYFVTLPTQAGSAATPSAMGPLPSSVITPALRQTLEKTLTEVLAKEWPRIRDEAAPELDRMAASSVDYHRAWARERREVEEALARGAARLSYEVDAFQLAAKAPPEFFVRAIWRVNERNAFAAAVWLRGEALEIVRADVRAASWLRMFEFQGRIGKEQLGLVLNVVDRDGDGWAEVLFGQGGYESFGIELLEFSPAGLQKTGLAYAYGC